MRNGNFSAIIVSELFGSSSYRTYEEWKRIITDAEGRTFQSSYRTYEEWKLCSSSLPYCEKTGSYRTYEEWKQAS